MSSSANPLKQKKAQTETEAAAAAKQQKADRERIRRLIITLGDENKKVVGQIRGLVGALEDDVELHGELMMETVLECAKCLPIKTSIFAALVARMVAQHAEWSASLVARAQGDLQAALRAGQVAVAQLLLRFFVELGNAGAVGVSSIVVLLQEVLATSEGLKSSKGGDMGVFLMLATLPFISIAAYKLVSDRVDSLLSSANAHLATRDARSKPLFRIVKGEETPDRLEALASMLRSLKQADWSSQTIFHVPGFTPCLEDQPNTLKLSPLAVTAEEIRKGKVRLQVPLVALRLVTGQLEQDAPDGRMAEHDRWILEDHILTTIDKFGIDVEECSRQILRIPVLHPHFDAAVIETLFSQMLQLPSPPLLPLFYSRLLEATVEKQTSMGKCVDQAYTKLFGQIPDLDEECLEVLAEAFAYHLVHNGYQADWSPFTGDGVAVQAQRFVRRVFERLQRLSFRENLVHRLPASMHCYIPGEPAAAADLPVQSKPEFTRMLTFVRIKDSNERKVLKYCQRLLKVQPKEEQKEEEAVPGAGAPVVAPSDEADPKLDSRTPPPVDRAKGEESIQSKQEEAECNQRSGEDAKEPPTKCRRLDGGDEIEGEAATPCSAAENTANGASEAPAAAATGTTGTTDEDQSESSKKRKLGDGDVLRVKEELKHEDEHSGGLLVASTEAADQQAPPADKQAPPASAGGAAKLEEDFGESPSEPWSLESVVELFTVSVLQQGAKTPTHMNKMLDGHQQVFAKLRPSEEEEAHSFARAVVRCSFEFWRLSGQRLEITLDMLVHRGIVTPRSVVEHALASRAPLGCDSLPVWNLINSVALKSLERSQSVRVELAMAKKLGKSDIVSTSRQQLDTAIHETAELFTLVFTGFVRNHQDFGDDDALLRHITLQRVLTIGRKYHAFIKPLIDTADSRIPGVAHNPEISSIFQALSTL